MQKSMWWIVLVISLLALIIAIFALYQIMHLTRGIFKPSNTISSPQDLVDVPPIAPSLGTLPYDPEYEVVSDLTFWKRRGELSGKKIELTVTIDTNTMVLQPPSFPNPIDLVKPSNRDANKDTWPRNQGRQTVVIQGVFNLTHVMGTVAPGMLEKYSIVVDRMLLKSEAEKIFSFWPDKNTPTDVIDTRVFQGFRPEDLVKLDGKPVVYVGVYSPLDHSRVMGVLDNTLAVDLKNIGDSVTLDRLIEGNIKVRVWGIVRLTQGLHGPTVSLEAGKIDLME